MITPEISVIVCIYNAQPLVQTALRSLIETGPSDGTMEVILVDNHSPDLAARQHAESVAGFFPSWMKVVRPDRNLGCHGGWNFGYQHVHPDSKYVCKFDDDTEILTRDWAGKMTEALDKVESLGFLSADIDAKQNNVYSPRNIAGVDIEIAITGVVGFSFVMFRRADIERWGPMKTGAYRAAGSGKTIAEDRLYGGEEVYYASRAREEGLLIAHFPPVKCHHMDNTERHPDYAMWKRVYGYHGWTNKDMTAWLADMDHLPSYRACLANEASVRVPNEALLRDWVKRLGEIGDKSDLDLIGVVMSASKNGVVQETCSSARKLIEERAC